MHRQRWLAKALIAASLAAFCSLSQADYTDDTSQSVTVEKQVGIASYYSDKFHGRRTASGERYDKNALTAVHSHLPFGTLIKVTNLRNHRTVELRVNDRKHAHNRRLLDVSKRAAQELGFVGSGLAKVEIEILRLGDT